MHLNHPLTARRQRREVEMRAYAVRVDGEIVDLRVLDLTYDGCGIETDADWKTGEELKLSVLGCGAVKARVRWSRGRKAGLRFEVDAPPRKHSPRQAKRVPLTADVSVRRRSKLRYRVRIFDASCYGCKFEFVERPRINEVVWVKFDWLEPLEAVVCWIEESKSGLRFAKPIHAAVFDMLLQRLMPQS
jgi:hypothetical protein